MSEQYTEAIAEVTCQTCPLRTINEDYWQENKRPDIFDREMLAAEIGGLIRYWRRNTEQNISFDLGELYDRVVDLDPKNDWPHYYQPDDEGQPQQIVVDGRQPLGQEEVIADKTTMSPSAQAVINCWQRVANEHACTESKDVDIQRAVQPNLSTGADVLESLAKHGNDGEVMAQCRELNLTFGDMALNADMRLPAELRQSAPTPEYARAYLLVLAEDLRAMFGERN